MKDKATYSIELEKEQHEFLEEMAKKFGLPDVDKAMRCLINYAREETGQQKDIFATVRCRDC